MAHQNINERRAFVATLLAGSAVIPLAQRREIAAQFNCSHAAIAADIVALGIAPGTPSVHCSPALRKLITRRDQICQYCGETSAQFVIEHIIPAAHGGPARPYNLVLSCQKCNARKGRSVWIPDNLNGITTTHPEWRARIIREAVPRGIPRHDGKLAAWLPLDDMVLAQRLMLHFPEVTTIDELFSLALHRLAAHTDD